MRTDEILNPFKKAEAIRKAKHIDDVINDMKDDGDLHGSNVSLVWAIDDVPMGYTHLLKPVLDKHKETILHRLLSRLKYELENDDLGRYTPDLVDALTRAGLDWPELNAIRKSLHSHTNKKSLDETEHGILDQKISIMSDAFDALRKDSEANIFPMNMLSTLRGLADRREVAEEEVRSALNGIKDKILTYILSEVKGPGTNWWYVLHCIDELHDFEIDWPELGIIRKSVVSVHGDINEDEDDSDDVAALQKERLDMIEEIIDAMTNGGSGRTFRAAKDTVQSLDRIGEDMLEDEMHRQKASIIANLVDMFFTSDRRTLESLMQLIECSPHRITEISNLPDSIMHAVEKEFDDRSRYHGLAKTLEDVEALSDNGFDREYLMSDLKEYKLSGFVRTYGINAYSSARDLGQDLAAMLELGVDKGELLPIVEKRKTTIMKALLVAMKNRGYHDVNLLMTALGDLGVDWSEFNAIRKSLGSLHTLG